MLEAWKVEATFEALPTLAFPLDRAHCWIVLPINQMRHVHVRAHMHTHQQQISILLPELNFIPSYFEWKKSDLRRFGKDERGFLDKRDFSGEGNHTGTSRLFWTLQHSPRGTTRNSQRTGLLSWLLSEGKASVTHHKYSKAGFINQCKWTDPWKTWFINTKQYQLRWSVAKLLSRGLLWPRGCLSVSLLQLCEPNCICVLFGLDIHEIVPYPWFYY